MHLCKFCLLELLTLPPPPPPKDNTYQTRGAEDLNQFKNMLDVDKKREILEFDFKLINVRKINPISTTLLRAQVGREA
jgi:hypothetical protein